MLTQGKTDTICTAFQQMLEIVDKPPGSIEEVTQLREYLEELPRLVEEQQDAIDAIGAIKDELEACQYGISDEAFSQMYKAIMWPAEIAQAGEALKPVLEKKQVRNPHPILPQPSPNPKPILASPPPHPHRHLVVVAG